jgi:hypothetical protein
MTWVDISCCGDNNGNGDSDERVETHLTSLVLINSASYVILNSRVVQILLSSLSYQTEIDGGVHTVE